ncbi:MAG: amidohydrolase family protein [Caldilineaceae bacterium]
MIIDTCVIPPLPSDGTGFADPNSDFAMYHQLYRQQNVVMESIQDDPVGGLLALMDEAGVDVAILPAEDAEMTLGMKTSNEAVAELCAQAPTRLKGMAGIDPHKGMKALRELDHAYHDLGMRSLCLEPWLHKLHANDKRYYPIYAKCVELDIPVWIHTSVNFAPKLSMEVGRPIYLDEVAGHFPELKIIAGHGGWPWVNELMAILWRHENVFADISAIRPRYVGTPGTGWETLIQYGNSLLQDKILFGTAWPAQNFKQCVDEVLALPIKDTVKRKWLGENAQRVFNLS